MCTPTCGMRKSQKACFPVILCAHAYAEPRMRRDACTDARLRTRQARKYKAMCLAGPDASKVAIGRLPPQVGILLANHTKVSLSLFLCIDFRVWRANAGALTVFRLSPICLQGWWDVVIQSTDDRIKCRVGNMQPYETGSAPPVVVDGILPISCRLVVHLAK